MDVRQLSACVALHEQRHKVANRAGLEAPMRPADRRTITELRHDLYEAHHLLDRIHDRFPETLPPHLRAGELNAAIHT